MTTDSEVRNGYVVSSEMKGIWNVELMLLKKLLDVCKENELTIWASGGTLLGTVREKGYIPWDDDIDVEMPRKDYDKLQTIAENAFSAPFVFQSGYWTGCSQLQMLDTSAIPKTSLFLDVHLGIGIDIFPIDVIPDNPQDRDKYYCKLKKNRRAIADYSTPVFYSFKLKVISRILFNRIKVAAVGYNAFVSRYYSIARQYQNMDYKDVAAAAVFGSERFIRCRDWYSGTLYMPFEDISMPVPIRYEAILNRQYGADYMTPKQEPPVHKGFLFRSTTQSYEEVLPQLRKQFKQQLKKRWRKHLLGIIRGKRQLYNLCPGIRNICRILAGRQQET